MEIVGLAKNAKYSSVKNEIPPQFFLPYRQDEHLGPILFQLPPKMKINLERLETFLKLLPRDVTSVFEFRNTSWYVPETYDLLGRHGAGFVVNDMPGSKSDRSVGESGPGSLRGSVDE